MGINPTPTNHRAFTYDGKSTREFGVYITGEGVFNAPERAVEMISIPGRDGEYALDQGHFNNIEVTYRAGIVADSTTDFAEAISNFRNWLASRKGYCRLTDEYNPNEYRMAVFKNVITVEHEGLETGEFDITFNCKPQRWLTSGETAVAVTSGGTITNPTLFPSSPLLAVEGYGSIGFNGYEIEIENVPIGDVTLASETSFFLENRTQTFSLDADKYNVGDIITVAVNQIGFDYSINTNTAAHAHSTTATDSMSGVTSTVKADTSFWGTGCLFYGTTKPSSITFTAGTSANFVNVVSGRLTIQLETLALRNILYTLTETVSYDATQNTISFSLSSTTSYDAAEVRNADLRNRFTPSKIDGINVFSTISAVDGTVYIDCEVGECWNVNDDVILPLNNVISLGSDLPTLPPGATEITFDNTFTELKVTPRWWKV